MRRAGVYAKVDAMKKTSIFNDVLGPVMRGPSSSHTAASYHIGRTARALLGARPHRARFRFDRDGSYYQVYEEQGADLAFAAGLMEWPIADERFESALDAAAAAGLAIEFAGCALPRGDHPNSVEIALEGDRGQTVEAVAKSTGGGGFVFTELNRWPVEIKGDRHAVAVEFDAAAEGEVGPILDRAGSADLAEAALSSGGRLFALRKYSSAPDPGAIARLNAHESVHRVWSTPPLFFIKRGVPLFASAAQMISLAQKRGVSLGRLALAYEAALLDRSEMSILAETRRRFDVMRNSISNGLDDRKVRMQLLGPSAGAIMDADASGLLAVGGMHTRAAARALAALHCNCSGQVVCAAPTGGSAGVLPGVIATLVEEQGLSIDDAALGLLAAGAVGVVVDERATFAAEIAGCQVEIGAAGAMAAAAVVDAAGGSAAQAADAAAIAFQNTMGSVCDLVQGIVEIPCHTRNAIAASSAFVCADLILGGYVNSVPLDETIDTVLAVGKAMPPELRVTARGGLAVAPSARALERRTKRPSTGREKEND